MDKSAGRRLLNSIRKDGLYIFYVWFFGKYTQLFYPEFSKDKASHVMKEEWDHLIVLDACRHDMFKEIVDPDAPFVISGGSGTQEWIEWNFNGRFDDTVCIAGNPHMSRVNLVKTFGFVPFYKVIDVWDHGWDRKLKTVPPETVTRATLEAFERYPDRRMLVHYNQPHHPFINDSTLLSKDEGASHTMEDGIWGEDKTTIWDTVKAGQIPLDRVWKGYRDNLRIVMKEVEKLVQHLPGRVIVTSDHGNHVGENGIYGHRIGIRSEQLVKVPWYTIKAQETTGRRVMSEGDARDREKILVSKEISRLKSRGRL